MKMETYLFEQEKWFLNKIDTINNNKGKYTDHDLDFYLRVFLGIFHETSDINFETHLKNFSEKHFDKNYINIYKKVQEYSIKKFNKSLYTNKQLTLKGNSFKNNEINELYYLLNDLNYNKCEYFNKTSKIKLYINDIVLSAAEEKQLKEVLTNLKNSHDKISNSKFLINYYKKVFSSTENALYINDAPTGIGKTHNIAEYIINYFLYYKIVENKDKKIFYFTDLKNNIIPLYQKIQSLIEELCMRHRLSINCKYYLLSKIKMILSQSDLYNLIFLPNNKENLLKKYDNKGYIEKNIKEINILKEKNNIESVEQMISSKISELFRYIRKIISENYENMSLYEKRFSNLFFDGEDVFNNNDSYVFFATTTKLNLPLHCINKTVNFLDDIEGHIVIIDEFDKQYNVLKDANINDEYLLDIYKAIRKISLSLNHIYKDNEQHSGNKINQERISFINNVVAKLEKLYHIKYSLENEGEFEEPKLLFDDNMVSSFVDFGNNIYFSTNHTNNLNKIIITDKNHQQLPDEVKFNVFFRDLVNFLNNFAKFMRKSSSLYKSKKNGIEYSEQEKIEALLNEISLEVKNLDKYILGYGYKTDNMIFLDNLKYSFINTPTELLIMVKELENVELKYKKYIRESNVILLNLIRRNTVLGISATANSKSVTNNFNYDYLNKFKEIIKIHKFSEQEIDSLVKELEPIKQQISKNINYNIYNLQNDLNHINDNMSTYANLLTAQLENRDKYTKELHKNFYKCVKDFINKENSKFLLVLTSRTISDKEIEVIFESLTSEPSILFFPSIKSNCKKFNSTYLNDKNSLDKINEFLSENVNNKVIVFTSYLTCGAGVNIQPKVKNKKINQVLKNFVSIKDFVDDDLKQEYDIDSLALFEPKNITFNNFKDNEYEYQEDSSKSRISQIISEIASCKSLLESAYLNPDTLKKYVNIIKNSKMKTRMKKEYSKLADYNYSVASIIKQAIGRINRTSIKNKDINIYLDNELINILNNQSVFSTINDYDTYDYVTVMKYIKENYTMITPIPNDRLSNRNQNNNMRTETSIMTLLNNARNGDLKEQEIWFDLRKLVLTTGPFIKDEEILLYNNIGFSNIFTELLENNDFYIYLKGKNEVTINDEFFNYHIIKKNNSLKKYFENNNFTLSCKKSKIALCPAICNNILKGAIGEEIGKWYFTKILKYEIVENIPEKFEEADFYVINDNEDIIAVDMKNYNISTREYQHDIKLLSKINRKIKENKFKMIVANTFLNAPKSSREIVFGNITDNNKFVKAEPRNSTVCFINGLLNYDGQILDYDKEQIMEFIYD